MHAFYDKVTDRARRALDASNEYARACRSILVNNLHLLWGLCNEGKGVAHDILQNLKVDVEKLKDEVDSAIGKGKYKSHGMGVPYDVDARVAICKAIDIGEKLQHIGSQHILLAILSDVDNPAYRLLSKWNVTKELVLAEIQAIVKPALALAA